MRVNNSPRPQVTQILSDLTRTFEGSIATAQEQERKALEQYDGLIRLKKTSLLQLQTSKDTKDALLAESEQQIAQLKRSIEDQGVLSKSGEQYMGSLKKICADTSNSWAARAQLHQDITSSLQSLGSSLNAQLNAQQPASSFVQLRTTDKMGDLGLSMVMPGGMAAPAAAPGPAGPAAGPAGPVAPAAQVSSQEAPPQPVSQPTGPQLAALQQQLQQGQLTAQSLQQQAVSMQRAQVADETSKKNTYAAVKHMVDEMIGQIQAATLDEDNHKSWCDAEIAKNQQVCQLGVPIFHIGVILY